MKVNIKIFSKISAVGLALITVAKIALPSMNSFLAVSVMVGIGIAAVYYSICDSEGNFRKG